MSNQPYLEPVDTAQLAFADFYDELPLWSAPFALELLEHVPLTRTATILDIGCGTGFLSIELAQRCGPASRVYAIDPWPAAMARLARKVEYYRLGNIELIERDAADTGLPSACANVIVSNLGINNFDNADAVLNECFRLAKPETHLLLTTNLAGHMREFYSAYRDVLNDLGLQQRLLMLAQHEEHRGTVASIRERLSQSGFRHIREELSEFRMRFADGSALLNHWFIRLGFLPGWRAILDGEEVVRVFDALEHRLNTLARRNGELALTIPVAIFDAHR